MRIFGAKLGVRDPHWLQRVTPIPFGAAEGQEFASWSCGSVVTAGEANLSARGGEGTHLPPWCVHDLPFAEPQALGVLGELVPLGLAHGLISG